MRSLLAGLAVTATISVHAACPFNVSGTGTVTDTASFDALRDGVLITRYAQGLRGAALVAGTGASMRKRVRVAIGFTSSGRKGKAIGVVVLTGKS